MWRGRFVRADPNVTAIDRVADSYIRRGNGYRNHHAKRSGSRA
jgi:hypothetical protein